MLLASATTLPLLLAATGCRSSEAFAGPDPLAGPPSPSPDVITLEAVIAAETNLIHLYKTAISGVSRATAPLLSQHEQHLAQLSARLILPSATSSPPGRGGLGGPGVPPGSGGSRGVVPPGLAQLRTAERESATSLVRQLGAAEPALAQLFASIAACHATHVAALGG
jgi:hypothetical protein